MKKTVSLLLALVLCLSLCACGEKATPEMIEAYNNANACFSQGRYEDAAKFYLEAGGYEDTQQKLLEIYYYAVNCFEQGKHEEAQTLFDVLSNWDQHKNAIACYTAIYNARIEFEKNRNILAAYEWLDVAMTYANEKQTLAVNEYKEVIYEEVYEGTLFWKPDVQIHAGNFVVREEGKYTHYHYEFLYGGDDDANNFMAAYKSWYNDYEREWFQPVPEWLKNITGMDYAEEVCYDDLGNIIAYDFSLSSASSGKFVGGTADVFIIYADYVKSVKN